MRWRVPVAALLAAILVTGRAEACPEASPALLWHSCWGEARAELLLLPEDLPLAPAAEGERRLTVTGAYTAREPREGGHPDPVGLFIRRGELVTREVARMDGVLVIDPEGHATIARREAVPGEGRSYDLGSIEQRGAFIRHAAEKGLSVIQTHLLVIDGESDVNETENAPAYVRRLLFSDEHGIGIWQTAWPVTLHEAARAIVADLAPRMAMNLDMGSYDFCLDETPEATRACGVIKPGGAEMSKLSNLLRLTLVRAGL